MKDIRENVYSSSVSSTCNHCDSMVHCVTIVTKKGKVDYCPSCAEDLVISVAYCSVLAKLTTERSK